MAQLKDTTINGNLNVSGDIQIGDTSVSDVIDDVNTCVEKYNQIGNLSNPNLLINGDFQVWQRGESFEINGTGQTAYNADRWCMYVGETDNVTIAKDINGIKITHTSETKLALVQKLEAPLIVGEDYTLSAKVNGVIRELHFKGGEYVDDYDLNLAYYNNSSLFDGIGVFIDTGITLIEWVKLEKGSIATPFISRQYIEEFQMCQRYYQNRIVNPMIIYKYNDNKIITCILLPVPMRTTPLVSSTYLEYYSGGLGKTDSYIETFGYCDNERITATIYCPSGLDSSAHSLVMSACFDAEIY